MSKSENDLKVLVNEEVNNLKRVIQEKDGVIKDYRKEHGVLETFFRDLKENIEPISPSPLFYKTPRSKRLVTSPCTAVLHITDGHMGAVQIAEEIEGFGEFSPQICRDRQIHFITQSVDWVDLHRASYRIDECVVIVTGDLISGDIHEELRVTNAFPTPVQCVEAGSLLADQISLLAPNFKSIRVEFIVEDNHSRLTKKPQCKEAGLNSFNYVVGFIAKEKLAKHKTVTFNIYPQYEKSIEVNGRRYLILHGNGIKGFAGTPWYGWDRKVAKEAIKRINGPDLNKFHRIIAGHFHTPITTPNYWLGGSVSGTDAYDHKEGRHSNPSQSSWLVHPKHGEFDRTDFNLVG